MTWQILLKVISVYIATEDYRAIWWKLFHAPNASKWSNALSLVELLFCFPMSNGRVERVFSSLKVIKTDRRSRLGEDRLDHLVRIAVDGPPFHQWDATDAVQLWWKSNTQRRQMQDTRARPTPLYNTTSFYNSYTAICNIICMGFAVRSSLRNATSIL